MEIKHHDLKIELNNEWWEAAGMSGFVPQERAYSVDHTQYPEVTEIAIEDIGPVSRVAGIDIFNDGEEGSARQRVVSILRGIRSGEALPPVEVVVDSSNRPHQYKLTHGAHRLYCSLAAGFSHVPAVRGFDWSSLDC